MNWRPEVYLKRLLEVLQGNYPVQDVSGDGGATGSGGFRSNAAPAASAPFFPGFFPYLPAERGDSVLGGVHSTAESVLTDPPR